MLLTISRNLQTFCKFRPKKASTCVQNVHSSSRLGGKQSECYNAFNAIMNSINGDARSTSPRPRAHPMRATSQTGARTAANDCVCLLPVAVCLCRDGQRNCARGETGACGDWRGAAERSVKAADVAVNRDAKRRMKLVQRRTLAKFAIIAN